MGEYKVGETVQAGDCILCGSRERVIVATQGRGYVPLATAICPDCGTVSHHPRPDAAAVAEFYRKKYRTEYKGGWEPKRKHSLRAIRGAVARARRLAALIPAGARVLDIGASSGEFTYAMAASGFAAEGLEPNEGYAEYARRTYGVTVTNTVLEDAPFAPSSFDLITLNHVFEHLVDPLAALGLIRGWLAPGGLLFIEVPNLAGVRKQITNVFHHAHIWNFTPETLLAVMRKGGFEPVAGTGGHPTSVVFRASAPDPAPVRHPGLAERLIHQMSHEQSPVAYWLSGAPFERRYTRLRRNIDELMTVRRHDSVRAMADAVIAQARIAPRPAGAPTPAPLAA